MSEIGPADGYRITRLIQKTDQSEILQVRKAVLEVVEGPDQGTQKEVPHHGLTIGSSPPCDLVLSDPGVSKRHMEVIPGPQGFLLRDLGSKNGTLIGNLLVREAVLIGEEEIRIGTNRLRLRLLKEKEDVPLSPRQAFGGLLGRSLAMREVFALLETAAGSNSTLLLEGESGTGKDLAAESVHAQSARARGPLVVLDCAAVGASLVESELFGHRKGAFTGAIEDRAGVFESADHGTVFLDEIGELAPAMQVKLLRLLEKREVRRLGENHYRQVDARLIAATNRDLTQEVEAGRFRSDLFYRLSVLRVRLPTLRERREDLGMLARTFIQKLRPELNPDSVVTREVLALFANHDWPGNVRELRNVIERLLLFPGKPGRALGQTKSRWPEISEELLDRPFNEARQEWLGRFDKLYLTALLDGAGGSVALAAERAGIPRQSLYRLLAKHGLSRR